MIMSQIYDLPESMVWRVIESLECRKSQRTLADSVGMERSLELFTNESLSRLRIRRVLLRRKSKEFLGCLYKIAIQTKGVDGVGWYQRKRMLSPANYSE
ncbi:hypothetical protein TNCV_3935691 [Trichonephila clavipes]|nr:hypothetical protein TNCV_3935691 [Trichonephila clavipes]